MINIHEDKRKHYSTYKPADDKNPVTGYYLTIDEYKEMENNLSLAQYEERQAKSKIKELEDSHKSEIIKIKERYQIQLNEARSDIEGEYYKELLEEHNKRLACQESAKIDSDLNRNFKRIARERANKKQNTNKHEPGYLFISWNPTTCQLKSNNEPITIPLYIINIQTPWDCSLSLADVDYLTANDIADRTLTILNSSGVSYFEKNVSLEEAVDAYLNNNNNSINCILTRKYKSNAKTGLWEVTLYTTFEPTIDAKHRKNYV